MNKRKLIVSFLLMVLAIVSSASICLADEQIDLRKTRIARVGFVEGEVNVQRQGTEQWDSAVVNVPVFPGDLVYTNRDSKMELELHGGFVRLSENTSLELVKFAPKLYRFDLSLGLATFSFGDERPEIEIATPQASISLKKAGIYRVKINLDGTTEILVQEGQAELLGRQSSFKLNKNKRAIFSPTNNVSISDFNSTDDWDKWNNEREHLVSVNSINGYLKPRPYLYGRSLLNQHGTWINVPRLGFVWKPTNVAAGWVPYRFGRWAHYRTVGWTWVSQEVWGWLPYHYGYWTYLEGQGWVWVPGDFDWFWSPSLVAWYYSTWNDINYLCWHPRTNNWPSNGGSAPWTPTKSKLPSAAEKVETYDGVISAIPVDTLLNGDGNSLSENKGYKLNEGMKLGEKVNLKDIAQPVKQGITPTISFNNIPNSELASRPLVTKFGEGSSNPHRKYDVPNNTNTSSSSNINTSSSTLSSIEKKSHKQLEDGSKVREHRGNIDPVNNNSSSGLSNSKPAVSEKIHSAPSVTFSPAVSSPAVVSPSHNGGKSGKGGN